MYCSSYYGVVLCTAHNVLAQKNNVQLMLNSILLYFTVFQRVLQMDAAEIQHEFIYVDRLDLTLRKQEDEGEMSLDTGQSPMCLTHQFLDKTA